MTDKSLTARLFADAGKVVWPTSAQQDNVWARSECWKGGARVDTEVTPKDQRGPKPRCRFDVVVPGVDVTAIIECKWGAGTSATQLIRYAEILRGDVYGYPQPILVLVSADGASPADVQALVDVCKVPLVFLAWTDIHPIVVGALGAEGPALEARMALWQSAADAFKKEVLGTGAIAKRTITGDEDEDDDECPDEGAVVTRVAGNGIDVSPKVLERIALLALAKECCDKLRDSTGLNWQMRSMPHVGPRGDVQCNIAPTDHPLGMLTRRGFEAEEKDRWSHVVGTFQRGVAGVHDEGNVKQFEAIRGYSINDDHVRLRASFRLYFSVDGTFCFQFGTAVTPYLMFALPKKKRHEMNLNLRGIGSFGHEKGTWQPTGRLVKIHDELRTLVRPVPAQWKKSGRDTKNPTMWNTYIEIKDIAKAGSAPRTDRIVVAVQEFLKRVG